MTVVFGRILFGLIVALIFFQSAVDCVIRPLPSPKTSFLAMVDPPSTKKTSPAAVAAIDKIESIIGKDEGGRGMESLVVPGDLLRGATRLALLTPSSASKGRAHVVLLSGFPCCVDADPPTETDGPPGTFAIAQAALGMGHRVTVVTDKCNEAVFAAAASSLQIGMKTYPSEDEMASTDWADMESLVKSADLIIACERAGPAKDGHCYTMRGIDMNERGLIAPLHRIVEMGRERTTIVPFVAIGDGGNELGMGKVLEAIVSNPKIKNGDKIASVTPADDLIAASVSNWGGYALAAAASVVRYDHDKDKKAVKSSFAEFLDTCVPREEDEVALLNRCVEKGCRDGVSGKIEATVDGMPLETSMKCLQDIRAAALEAGM
mmetsp:Transcript_6116/g.13340  ORF Transcript_6116/g.13340 Transcript_6116/m.13340 type:complete len:377 (+) Transcript_6116:200-1330(+)